MSKELKKLKGEKRGVPETDSAPKRELPRITFTATDLPEIKDWKVGGKYYLELEVEQVAVSKNEYGFEEDKELKATFRVAKVKALNNPGKEKVEFGNYKNPNKLT